MKVVAFEGFDFFRSIVDHSIKYSTARSSLFVDFYVWHGAVRIHLGITQTWMKNKGAPKKKNYSRSRCYSSWSMHYINDNILGGTSTQFALEKDQCKIDNPVTRTFVLTVYIQALIQNFSHLREYHSFSYCATNVYL